MNCNLCPYRKLCVVSKSQGFDYENGQPFNFTTPSIIDECPLYRVLKEGDDNQNP